MMALNCAAIQLRCDYSLGSTYGSDASKYFCDVKNLNITTRNVKIDGLLINYTKGHVIRGLEIIHRTCHYFPKGIENVFGNLLIIEISNSNLKQITKSDLQPFTELIELDLKSNDLEVIEKDLFMYNKKLNEVWFDHNKLKHIDNMAFESTQLKFAFFENNPCISMDADTEKQITTLKREIAQSCQNVELAKQHDKEVADVAVLDVENKSTQKPSEATNDYETFMIIVILLFLFVLLSPFAFLAIFYLRQRQRRSKFFARVRLIENEDTTNSISDFSLMDVGDRS